MLSILLLPIDPPIVLCNAVLVRALVHLVFWITTDKAPHTAIRLIETGLQFRLIV